VVLALLPGEAQLAVVCTCTMRSCSLSNESRRWTADAVEHQLAHVEVNAVRGTYARGEHWDERKKMMVCWANYLDQLKNVGTADLYIVDRCQEILCYENQRRQANSRIAR